MQTRNSKRSRNEVICICSWFWFRSNSQSDVVCDSRSLRICRFLHRSKSLYDCLIKFDTTQKKRFMINVMNLWQSYEEREITKIKWIHEIINSIDFMIKSKTFSILKTLIDINTINMNINEWIERSAMSRSRVTHSVRWSVSRRVSKQD
jgi:hypothetical protein